MSRKRNPLRRGREPQGAEQTLTPSDAEQLREVHIQSAEVGYFPQGIVSVGDPTSPPSTPTDILASAGLRSILVEWARVEGLQTVDGAGAYVVELDTISTFDSGFERSQRTSATLATFTDLAPDTTYFARVRAVRDADNFSDWSASADATTAQVGEEDIQAGAVTADKVAAGAITAGSLASITMEVGKFIESSNYDGTDIDTGDSTQGWRIEDDQAEFNDVKVRGEVRATRLVALPGTTNIIGAGTFESSTEGWTAGNAATTVTRVSTSPHSGSWCLRITTGGSGDAFASSPFVEVEENVRALRMSLWARLVSSANGFAVRLAFYDATMTLLPIELRYANLSGTFLGTSWSLLGEGASVVVPEDAAYYRMEVLEAEGTGGGGAEFYIDDIMVVPAPLVMGAFRTSDNDYAINIVGDDEIEFARTSDAGTVAMSPHLRSDKHLAGANTERLRTILHSGNYQGRLSSSLELKSAVPTDAGGSAEDSESRLRGYRQYLDATRLYLGLNSSVDVLGEWLNYTPTLRNGTTDVSGSVVSARYMVIGKTCFVTARMNVTGTGVAGGMFMGLPLEPKVADVGIGMGSHYDESVNTAYMGIAYSRISPSPQAYIVRDGSVGNSGHGPALDSGDVMWLNCQYEIA